LQINAGIIEDTRSLKLPIHNSLINILNHNQSKPFSGGCLLSNLIVSRKYSQLSLIQVHLRCFWNVYVVKNAVMRHYRQFVIFDVECHGLQFLLNFNLGSTLL
jgi:hypothetical protein